MVYNKKKKKLSFLRSFLCKFRDNELKAAQSIFKAWYMFTKNAFPTSLSV